MSEFWLIVFWMGAAFVTGALGYFQGRRDERLMWLDSRRGRRG